MKVRSNNFEILRILCMLMIIYWHSCVHGLKLLKVEPTKFPNTLQGLFNLVSAEILLAFAAVAVNCYILISGYFLINNTNPRWKKIGKIWLEVAFYSVIFIGMTAIFDTNIAPPLLKSFLQIFPILSKQYYFVSNYLALMAISPYLARMVLHLSKNEYQKMLVLGFLLNSCLYTFSCGYSFPYGMSYGGAYSLMWFIYLFLVGGYVRKFDVPNYISKKSGILFCVISLFLGIYSVIKLLRSDLFVLQINHYNYNGYVFFGSVCLFLYFKKYKFSNPFWNVISHLSPYTLGVYIIHDNYYVRHFLWCKAISVSSYVVTPYFIMIILIIPFVIYLVCVCVDWIRYQFFYKVLKME